MQKIFSSLSASEINIVKSILENNNIETYVFNEHINTVLPHLALATGGTQVFVNKKNFEKAKIIINEYLKNKKKNTNYKCLESEVLEKDNIKCPTCNSKKIIQRIKQRGLFSLIISFLFGFFFPIKKIEYLCKNCQHIWTKKLFIKRFIYLLIFILFIILINIFSPVIDNIFYFYNENQYYINKFILSILFLILIAIITKVLKNSKNE